ncbi:MAG: hypothetical protein ACMUEM_04890 [Flavobacteriales bacterium AspAUS03]
MDLIEKIYTILTGPQKEVQMELNGNVVNAADHSMNGANFKAFIIGQDF